MSRTVEEINEEIKKLYQERNKAMAITADGHPIEIGMTLYTWDGLKIAPITVPENVEFTDCAIRSRDFYIDEAYLELFVDRNLAVEQALKMAKDRVAQCQRSLEGAYRQLFSAEDRVK